MYILFADVPKPNKIEIVWTVYFFILTLKNLSIDEISEQGNQCD